jgi:hypothetical protein
MGVAVLQRPSATVHLRQLADGLPRALSFLLGFLLIVYLAMNGGGVEPVVRGQIGVALWWILLVGAVATVLPHRRLTRAGWVALGLLALFCAWTAVGMIWTESSERTLDEVSRVAMHVGVLALALSTVKPTTIKHMVAGAGAAIAVVAWVALLSRLHPAWFPIDRTGDFLPPARTRLTYPVNYWNALAALIALGLPAVLAIAANARRLALQALAAAALPGMALAGYLTLSRGGAIAAGIALVTFVALTPFRLRALASLVPAATGAVILGLAVEQRPALAAVEHTAAARQQGDEVLVMVLVVSLGVALLQVAGGLMFRCGTGMPWAAIGQRRGWSPLRRLALAGTLAGCLAFGAFTLAGGVGGLTAQWHVFKNPDLGLAAGKQSTSARFTATSGNGRYQYWASSAEANTTSPLTGIGAGTWEYWWARQGTLPGFVRDAHSLYFQTLAELGWVGLACLASFLLTVLFKGVTRSLRGSPTRRIWTAAAAAGCVAFCFSAAIDWVWQVPVVPVAFLILAAVVLVPSIREADRRPGWPTRLTLSALAVLALVATTIPLIGAASLRASEDAARSGRIDAALAAAATAARAEPFAASPLLQQAVLLESRGDIGRAVALARSATRTEPTNWRNWITLSRLEARNGSASRALAAYRTARSLNPRSPLFTR